MTDDEQEQVRLELNRIMLDVIRAGRTALERGCPLGVVLDGLGMTGVTWRRKLDDLAMWEEVARQPGKRAQDPPKWGR